MSAIVMVWLLIIFIFGSCVGSFLNVVIYRLPKGKSLVTPASACPVCNSPIRFYDNIPLISWILLGARCRHCSARISPRYFVVELITALVFTGLFLCYFVYRIRWFPSDASSVFSAFVHSGWFVYLVHIILLSCLIAASGIDLELWVIPLSLCWFAAALGIVSSAVGVFVIDPAVIRQAGLLPSASPRTGALAAGAAAGLLVSLLLLGTRLLRRSYLPKGQETTGKQLDYQNREMRNDTGTSGPDSNLPPMDLPHDDMFNHRLEVLWEVLFLLPVVFFASGFLILSTRVAGFAAWWESFSQHPVVSGLLGSFWGYIIGGAVVWVTRILGTLAFGKEAMGLGDVHLMAAVGTVIGAVPVVVAFFAAPFLGLIWAGIRMFFKKTHQIPYGPFLAMAVFGVMILYDAIMNHPILELFR
ncbi:MAG: prepilin peptidase [Planctomycetota bacterium]